MASVAENEMRPELDSVPVHEVEAIVVGPVIPELAATPMDQRNTLEVPFIESTSRFVPTE
jgi:hypothetical protein